MKTQQADPSGEYSETCCWGEASHRETAECMVGNDHFMLILKLFLSSERKRMHGVMHIHVHALSVSVPVSLYSFCNDSIRHHRNKLSSPVASLSVLKSRLVCYLASSYKRIIGIWQLNSRTPASVKAQSIITERLHFTFKGHVS